jgi:hypothetical protein
LKQIKNLHEQISEFEYLNSYNLARNSNKVFGESISYDKFEKLNLPSDSYEIYEKTDNYLTYRLKNIEIQDGDIVFCKTDFIFELFSILATVSKKIKVSIITHQSAQPSVDKSFFLMKPKCVQKWFSININYNHPSLISIPLGIANDYSPKNIKVSDFKLSIKDLDFQKEYLAYLNFSSHTNNQKRKKIIDDYGNKSWVQKNSNIATLSYMNEVANSKYVFSPPGWGIDTHRFWEALYLGSIPIVEYSINNSMFNMYPIVFYDENQPITESELLDNYDSKLRSIDTEKLTVSWWFNNIIQSQCTSSGKSIKLKYHFFHKLVKRILKIKYRYFKYRNKH